VTFFATFRALPAARFLAPVEAFRDDFLGRLEAFFPGFPAALAAFLAVLGADLATLRPGRLAALAASLPMTGLLDALVSTAPMAAKMRLISWVTCSMVIMPSTVSNLRRSE
jgi:hypothetical protein